MLKDKVVGVVAEFNPFHNGHKYQVDRIREDGAALVVAVITGNFVQRGEISSINKFDKAKIALECGYDLVVELPVYYAIQNADIFAEYSTKILEKIGVQVQVFGIEGNFDDFEKIIKLQENQEYIAFLKEFQKQGYGYIKAHELTLEKFNFSDVYKSNNILAISYIRSIMDNNLKLEYYPIIRKNVGYNEMNKKDKFASASYIRRSMGNKELIKDLIPESSFNVLEGIKTDVDEINDRLFDMFKYVFNAKTKYEIIQVYDLNDSIYNRLQKIINTCSNYKEFTEKIQTRSISLNRIKRLILNILLNIKSDFVFPKKEIEYVRILGLNSKAAKHIKELGDTNIYSNWKDIEKNFDVSIEKRAFVLHEILTKQKEKLNTIYRG